MQYRLAIEDIEPNHWLGWLLDLPGCFSSARTESEAIAHAPESIRAYFCWLSHHDSSLPLPEGNSEVEVGETFYAFPSQDDPEYLVNAFFEDDRRPLDYGEIDLAQRLLDWTRQDLLKVVQGVEPEKLRQPINGEVHGSILGLLEHVTIAENWYFSHLDLALDGSQLSADPFEKLHAVRVNTHKQIVKLGGDRRIVSTYGELWSARKILRRTLWHERDHTQHIVQLLEQGGRLA